MHEYIAYTYEAACIHVRDLTLGDGEVSDWSALIPFDKPDKANIDSAWPEANDWDVRSLSHFTLRPIRLRLSQHPHSFWC